MTSPIPRTRAAVALSALLLSACGGGASAGPEPIAWLSVALVDSVPWDDELSSGVLRRVQVRHGSDLDTIPGVLTAALPAIGPDGRVHGIAFEEGAAVHGFRYAPGSGDLDRIPLPAGARGYLSAPALAPDGRHLAYVAVPGDGTARAVVRSWPDRDVVARGPQATLPGTDAARNRARWIDSETFEVLVDLLAGRWQRVRGSLGDGAVRVDTVAPAPR